MLLLRRALLRAEASAVQQLRFDSSSCGGPMKNMQKPKPEDPGKGSETDQCWKPTRRSESKCLSDPEFKVPITFMEAQTKCSPNPCVTSFPPRDLTLYKPSDKLNRTYKRTWCEFELHQRKRKAVCKSRPVVYERRARPERKEKKPCPKSNLNLGLGECIRKVASPCSRVKLNYCKDASKKGCFVGGPPSGCVKRKTKYPSYSECCKDPLPDLRPSECFCLKTPPMCAVWNYYRMKKS